MRISDWSSDVCSSDLIGPGRHQSSVWRTTRQRSRTREAVLAARRLVETKFSRLALRLLDCTRRPVAEPWPARREDIVGGQRRNQLQAAALRARRSTGGRERKRGGSGTGVVGRVIYG